MSLDKVPISGPVRNGERVEAYACLLVGNVPQKSVLCLPFVHSNTLASGKWFLCALSPSAKGMFYPLLIRPNCVLPKDAEVLTTKCLYM